MAEATSAEPMAHFSRPSPPPDLSGTETHAFTLRALADQLMHEKAFADGQNGLTLVHRKDLSVVLSVAAAGHSIEERLSPGATWIQVLFGEVTVRSDGHPPQRITGGNAIAFGPDATHQIHADKTSALLIVIGAQN
jgi:quercetin dioxygenase-like cupin family protein